jgi:cytochrome c peroxidase
MRRLLLLVAALAVVTPACQRAERYGERRSAPTQPAPPPTTEPKPQPLDSNITWRDPVPAPPPEGIRIEFIHPGTDRKAWDKLPEYWNAPPLAREDQAAAVIGLSPLAVAAAATGDNVVRIKVPLGLDDPQKFVPPTNPITLARWRLGKRLFFDDSWLEPKTPGQAGVSCASCHNPKTGFADRKQSHRGGFNAPTLVNCVYNRRQFWDGRAEFLEEVVQRSLEDEREPTSRETFHHVWHGVIGRLRDDFSISDQFQKAFGTEPTQDGVGRALAVYLRTILAGNSIYDRAVAEQTRTGSPIPEAAHWEAVLKPEALAELGRTKDKPGDVAHSLLHGEGLFYDRDRTGRTNCAVCHSGQQFTDGAFHNLGIEKAPEPGEERGRFTTVGIGQKDRSLINAFKTPTLRNLLRTPPYLHDGSGEDLKAVVSHHATDVNYLDPLMRDAKGRVRGDDLSETEIADLVLFLHALNGEEPAAILSKSPGGR